MEAKDTHEALFPAPMAPSHLFNEDAKALLGATPGHFPNPESDEGAPGRVLRLQSKAC